MSAAEWRRAMNTGAGRQAWSRMPGGSMAADSTPATPPAAAAPGIGSRIGALLGRIRLRHLLVLVGVLVYPWLVNPFFAFQIGGQALALGLIALSLTFLGGYGGMVSLAQMSIAALASYMVAIFGVAGAAQGGASSLGWPWGLAVLLAVVVATLFATLVGWLSVRTEGIYTIMITLAIGVSFYYLAQQNYSVFGGHEGFNQVYAPTLLGIDFREPTPYYYLALFWALAGYFLIKYLLRTPFGMALQGVRENPRRMNALGFHVTGIGEHGDDAEHPHHRGDGRHEASDRRLRRRDRLRPGAEFRHRHHRPGAFQPGDRRGVPVDRSVFARRAARSLGLVSRPLSDRRRPIEIHERGERMSNRGHRLDLNVKQRRLCRDTKRRKPC
jgi:hypothetical protein